MSVSSDVRCLAGLSSAVARAQNAVNSLGEHPTEAQLRLASANLASALALGLEQLGVRPAAVHELAVQARDWGIVMSRSARADAKSSDNQWVLLKGPNVFNSNGIGR